MPIYRYECPAEHRSEELVPVDTASIACPECGLATHRIYGYSMAITQPEPDTRGMFRRYQEASSELERRSPELPSLWQPSKARAQAIQAAGESAVRRGPTS